ncbi:MAG: hypothetical protein ABJA82_06795 [Myxococcales bacterium]
MPATKRRPSVGSDPFALVVPTAPPPATTSKPLKVTRVTAHLEGALADAARDCVVALAGPPEALTMTRLCENAVRAEIDRLARKHNGGKPFPARGPLAVRRGRPLAS